MDRKLFIYGLGPDDHRIKNDNTGKVTNFTMTNTI